LRTSLTPFIPSPTRNVASPSLLALIHTLTLTLMNIHSLSLSLSLTHTHTHTRTKSSHSYTYTLIHTLHHTHTHTHSHANTHTHTQALYDLPDGVQRVVGDTLEALLSLSECSTGPSITAFNAFHNTSGHGYERGTGSARCIPGMSVWVAVVTSEHLMPILDATKSSKKVLRAACCAVCCLLILHYPITGILSPSLSLSLSPNPHSFHFFPFFSTYTKTTHPYPSLLSSPPLLYFFPSPSFPLSLSVCAVPRDLRRFPPPPSF
jgi:hypothetical protein